MLGSATHGHWEAVFELQNKRDLLIGEFFTQALFLDPQAVREGIQYILDSDAKLAEFAAAERKSLQKQMHAVKQNQQAARAYNAAR
ncbi:flagellar protein FliT [Methylomonas sp. MgM2]